ncbi:alpha-amylase family glycosyl hydrolase [Clostridium sp. E02]|uniref:alpha-amylase family glycosyl hydrolase n=1 Tax=Clostridium sp. E02 TaxID=2487134 RepID=UPI000F51F988|nr:alpha-amylase family glycosyl hydrolase [Clostridium sp. E02]
MNKENIVNWGPMLNAYPDSIGEALSDSVSFLKKAELEDIFSSFYILPSVFNTDLDRGFSIIDYNLNENYATAEDISELQKLGIDLKFDFVLNHASVLSRQFQDILKNGEDSKYKDFFINWNKFWENKGVMTQEGYIQPDQELIKDMFFRKPGLPLLMVRMPDGTSVPYWNTFYQEVNYKRIDAQDLMKEMDIQYLAASCITDIVNNALDDGGSPADITFGRYDTYKAAVVNYLETNKRYLGQMDLNIKSPLVWEYYENTLKSLADYGARIVRLDAFAYAPKEPGEKNFLNSPGTWDLLEKVQEIADKYQLKLLPEIHSSYGEKTYEVLSQKGYVTYDFFLPGLIIDALERHSGEFLVKWANEIQEKQIMVVNMLGCHDGIPLLDLKGLIPDDQIEKLIDIVVKRGGYVKNLHGEKNVYYQVNATYYSALGEDDKKMLLARALQIFMPGKPQVWYLDLFAGKNDHEAVKRAGAGGHKEINRTNLSWKQIEQAMKQKVFAKQIELVKFRNQFKAFGVDAKLEVKVDCNKMHFVWSNNGYKAVLDADLSNYNFEIAGTDTAGSIVFKWS